MQTFHWIDTHESATVFAEQTINQEPIKTWTTDGFVFAANQVSYVARTTRNQTRALQLSTVGKNDATANANT